MLISVVGRSRIFALALICIVYCAPLVLRALTCHTFSSLLFLAEICNEFDINLIFDEDFNEEKALANFIHDFLHS